MGCLYSLLGGLGGAVLFFMLPGIFSGGNMSGLVGLMIAPIGFIVGAVVGGIYWAERPEKNRQQTEDDAH